MSNNKSPHSSSKEYENKPEDISVSGSFDLSHDDLDAELIPENARKCTSVYRRCCSLCVFLTPPYLPISLTTSVLYVLY